MKFLLTLIAAFALANTGSAQDIMKALGRPSRLDMTPGYISINELNFGAGAKDQNISFSGFYIGLTTLHGYQINRSFSVSGGTGLLMNNTKTFAPLFIDFRCNFYHIYSISSYIFTDAGLLADLSSNGTGVGLYLNPGAGVRYDYTDNTAFNFGIGLLMQNGTISHSMVNFKFGIFFKPSKKS